MNIFKGKGKTHVNVGTIGHIDHARSAVAASAVMSEWCLLQLQAIESKRPDIVMVVGPNFPLDQSFALSDSGMQLAVESSRSFNLNDYHGLPGAFPKNALPPRVSRKINPTRARRP